MAIILENSRLIFDDTADYTLDAEYIMVNGGHLIMGTEDNPHTHKLVLTFHG
ncbi:MAG: G8 domain-containing protein [Anaerolineales bacterium]|nr:G8 domain-containing protein [Anaerolineales bacterium]